MAGESELRELLKSEINQLNEEGKVIDCDFWLNEINSCENDKEKLMQVYKKLCDLPVREDYGYIEPSELEDIYAESDIKKLSDDEYK